MKISKNLSLSEMLKSGTARRKGIENIPTEVSATISKKLLDAIPEACKRINELTKNN